MESVYVPEAGALWSSRSRAPPKFALVGPEEASKATGEKKGEAEDGKGGTIQKGLWGDFAKRDAVKLQMWKRVVTMSSA